MGCVGSKKEQKAVSKGDHQLTPPPHTAHYVKDPTATDSKDVSSLLSGWQQNQAIQGMEQGSPAQRTGTIMVGTVTCRTCSQYAADCSAALDSI